MKNFSAYIYNENCKDRLQELCTPLSSHLGISYFRYMKFFYDGKYLSLCNRSDYNQFYLEKVLSFGENFSSAVKKLQSRESYYYVWPTHSKDYILSALCDFNIWNGLTFFIRGNQYIEGWSFATNKNNNEAISCYLNNLPFLQHFIVFLSASISDFLNCPHNKLATFDQSPFDADFFDKSISHNFDQFIKETEITSIELESENDLVHLTRRELSCLLYLSAGMSAKEIGIKLEISPRTVEYYINQVKIKTRCNYKSDLIYLVKKSKKLKNIYFNY